MPGGGGGPTEDPPPGLPEEAYAIGLSMLPSVGPTALRRMLNADIPSKAWARATGTPAGRRRTGADPGADSGVQGLVEQWHLHRGRGIEVLLRDHPDYPVRLAGDPRAPGILFCLGRTGVLSGAPTVALVGTRAPTRYGIGVAAQLGADLAAAGVSVVSGLALGIDAAAHEGACGAGAPPIAVVAGGLDHPYPRSHERLWERVAAQGVVVSESPAGVSTERWRFPTRNKLLAALSDVVVVVESRHQGGSRHTVDAALERGVTVGAVPGSIRSETSEGPNALIADGAFPVCSTADILLALSLDGAKLGGAPRKGGGAGPPTVAPTGVEGKVYEVLTTDPVPLDVLTRLTGLGISELCGVLERLAQEGLATDGGGWWARA
jgi:DNA processing protein